MKKINDLIAAGVIIGCIGNIFLHIFRLLIRPLITSMGIKTRTSWNDLASLFFKPPEVYTFWAQFYGFLVTFGVSITNCIVLGVLLRFTGRDFAYLKSMIVCTASVMFAFMILYPSLGLVANQHSIATTYYALFVNELFAILVAYLYLRITNIGMGMQRENK